MENVFLFHKASDILQHLLIEKNSMRIGLKFKRNQALSCLKKTNELSFRMPSSLNILRN